MAQSQKKRKIISTLFPRKIIFDGNDFRILQLNDAISMICGVVKSFSEMKKETNGKKSQMSLEVSSQRLELWTR
jgi:site-specific DNA recombinase